MEPRELRWSLTGEAWENRGSGGGCVPWRRWGALFYWARWMIGTLCRKWCGGPGLLRWWWHYLISPPRVSQPPHTAHRATGPGTSDAPSRCTQGCIPLWSRTSRSSHTPLPPETQFSVMTNSESLTLKLPWYCRNRTCKITHTLSLSFSILFLSK